MTLPAGTRLGPYEIISPLGTGGMGEVYKGRDTRLDRIVAIKVLPEQIASDPQFRERFDREARTISRLDDPHVCALHDIGRENGVDFLVMQFLDGQTLADRLSKGPLPLDQALRYGIEIAGALDKAHRAGIVHRDLKPGNIMLVRRGGASGPPVAVLLDFGLAKAGPANAGPYAQGVVGAGFLGAPKPPHGEGGSRPGESMLPTTPPGLTAQGTILGTFQYMAPEQLEGQEADARTDIFAFGTVLYEMLTGKKAFEGRSQASLIGAILKDEPPPVSQVQPIAPPALDRVVKTCLAKDPDGRWQSVRDMRRELQWTAEAPGAASRTIAPRLPLWRRPVSVAVAALVVLLPLAFFMGKRAPIESTDIPPTRFVFEPPQVRLSQPAVSPDAQWLVFVGTSSRGERSLWVRDNRSAAIQELPGTAGAARPFWSPDSRYVAFVANQQLKRIEIGRTGPETISTIPSSSTAAPAGSWNADGTIILSDVGLPGLLRVGASGGTPVPLTKRDEAQDDGAHLWPSFLPDGRRFLFWIRSSNPDRIGLYVGSLDGAEPVRVSADVAGLADTSVRYASPGYLVFVRQREVLAQAFNARTLAVTGSPIPLLEDAAGNSVSLSNNGILTYVNNPGAESRLTWIDRSGREAGTVGEPGNYSTFDLSKDASRAVLSRTQGREQNLWVVDLERGSMSRLTLDQAGHVDPRWSPDSREVIFGSTRDLSRSPFRVSLAAPDPVPVFKFDGVRFGLDDWSPDGQHLLYHDAGVPGLWAVRLEGDRKPYVVTRSLSGTIDQAQFSPDGRWIAYNTIESGRYEVEVVPFPATGDKWRLSTAGGVQPAWRGDGRELYFLRPDSTLMATNVQPGATFQWSEARPLFKVQLTPTGTIEQYAPAPDGNRFLFVKLAEGAPQPSTTIVMNWPALLRN